MPEGAEVVRPQPTPATRPAKVTDRKDDPQREQLLEAEVTTHVRLPYLLALPKGYEADQQKQWPVVVFLHGAGERGANLEKLKAWGPPRMLAEGHDLGAIVVSPQCPANSWWTSQVPALSKLLDEIEAKYRVDRDRIYLTGLSMGGYGTFAWGGEEPERFAALLPICGGGDLIEGRRIGQSGVPIWIFHGTDDHVVPVEESNAMYERIRDARGGEGAENVQLTLFEGVDHLSWPYVYADEAVWKWMFEQRRMGDEGSE